MFVILYVMLLPFRLHKANGDLLCALRVSFFFFALFFWGTGEMKQILKFMQVFAFIVH